MKKLISLLCLLSLLMGILSLAALPTVALSANGGDVLFSNVLLNVGTDESERRITWYSNREGFGEVHYAKASDGADGEFPTSYQTSKASVHITSTDDTSYKASLTGLEPDTEYVYRLAVDGVFSQQIYRFQTKGGVDDLSFVLVGDPQIGSSASKWHDTLQKINANFPDSAFILSAGDQISNPVSEEGYDALQDVE